MIIMANRIFAILSIVIFIAGGVVYWMSKDFSDEMGSVKSQMNIYSKLEPSSGVFKVNLGDEEGLAAFNTQLATLLSAIERQKMDLNKIGVYKGVEYQRAIYDFVASDGYVNLVKFVSFLADGGRVHRINTMSVGTSDTGKLAIKVNFEVLGYVKEN